MAGMHGESFNFHVSAETLRIPRGLSIHSTSLAPSPKSYGGARNVDELEMRAGKFALWRCERWRGLRSVKVVAQRTRSCFAPLHAGNDSVRWPAHRRDGTRHGNKRTDHGLVHGHILGLSRL